MLNVSGIRLSRGLSNQLTWVYVTEYSVQDSEHPFWFATIRLAGHEAPTFQPSASFDTGVAEQLGR